MARNMYGQRAVSAENVGATNLANEVYHLAAADSPFLIEKPVDDKIHMLVLIAEAGDWRMQLGDHVSDPLSSAAPSATVSDGTGSIPLFEGKDIVITAPSQLTVAGPTNGILTYYWI